MPVPTTPAKKPAMCLTGFVGLAGVPFFSSSRNPNVGAVGALGESNSQIG
jgi:hypothetical protein